MSARQPEIVGAAIQLISKGGIQGLTTKNLATRLKLSEPALYRHFKNKRDILLAILEFFQENQTAMYARIAAAGDSPLRGTSKLSFFQRTIVPSATPGAALTPPSTPAAISPPPDALPGTAGIA